jgi:hypothetical protein
MVKTSLATLALALVVLAGTARADDADDDPGFNMLGFRFGVGALPIEDTHTMTFSLGLGVEHPVFTRTRVFGEYEWLWLLPSDARAASSMLPRPEEHGSGHRTLVGLRRELTSKRIGRGFSLFLDTELGGGVALVDDNMRGMSFLPTAFIGLRGGYDFYSREDDSPSRTFEAELLVRAVAIQQGIGMLFGVGMFWGN